MRAGSELIAFDHLFDRFVVCFKFVFGLRTRTHDEESDYGRSRLAQHQEDRIILSYSPQAADSQSSQNYRSTGLSMTGVAPPMDSPSQEIGITPYPSHRKTREFRGRLMSCCVGPPTRSYLLLSGRKQDRKAHQTK